MCLGASAIVRHSRESFITIGAPGVQKKIYQSRSWNITSGASQLTKRVKIATSLSASITASLHMSPSSLSISVSLPFSAFNMPPSPHVNLLLQWHASLGESFLITPQPLHKRLWVMHRDVIQIIKHNGDNDAFLKPCFLPDVTAVHSTQWTNPPYIPLPLQMNPMSPSHLFEDEHVLSCWGESFHFTEHFAIRKIFLFLKDLSMSQPPQHHHFITYHDAGFLFWKGFRVRGLEISISSFSAPSQSRVIIHSGGLVRDDAQLTFSLTGFVVADPKQKGLSELKICCFLPQPQLGLTYLTSKENISIEPQGFSFSYLHAFRWNQHMWSKWKYENTIIFIYF